MTYASTLYPYSKDLSNFFEMIDGVTPVDSTYLQDKLGNTILVLEKELGIKPSGTYSDVRQRLDAIEASFDIDNALPHSTTITTKYRHNIINQPITYPDTTTKIMKSVVGKIMINPKTEAGFSDGYGMICISCRFYVDIDITDFEISLWDTTQNPIQITSNIFDAGEHTYYAILSIPLENIDKVYEIRACQTTTTQPADNINSIIWNSRFIFIPTSSGGGGGGGGGGGASSLIEYVLTNFTPSDVIIGKKTIGTIPAAGMIQSSVIIINVPFDGNTTISVGDDADHSSLMSSGLNIPSESDHYFNDNDKEYSFPTDIKLYFTGNPTVGQGTAITYFHSGQSVLKYVSTSFSYNDIISGNKLIGLIPKGAEIQSVVLSISSAFDGNSSISVGDESNNASLMTTNANIPSVINKYKNDSDVQYSDDTNIKLYFTGTPTTGQGSVIVYFH